MQSTSQNISGPTRESALRTSPIVPGIVDRQSARAVPVKKQSFLTETPHRIPFTRPAAQPHVQSRCRATHQTEPMPPVA